MPSQGKKTRRMNLCQTETKNSKWVTLSVFCLLFLVSGFPYNANAAGVGVLLRGAKSGIKQTTKKHCMVRIEKPLRKSNDNIWCISSPGFLCGDLEILGRTHRKSPNSEPSKKKLEPINKAVKAFHCALASPTGSEIVGMTLEEIGKKFVETLQEELKNSKPEDCK